MKRNIILAIAAMFTLSIGAAVYAFNSTTTTTTNAAVHSCCCKGDSCPMKSKDAKASADAKESCCKDGCCSGEGKESCPMKAKTDASTATATAADSTHSCPMMKDGKMADHHKDMKGMDHKDMNHAEHKDMKHDGEHSCGCACCANHKEKKTETVSL